MSKEKLTLQIHVDAQDLTRGLLSSRITFPVSSGSLDMWFPKWIPGIHSPCGPVQNIAGLKFSQSGAPLPWSRSSAEPYRFNCPTPKDDALQVDLRYICNQPSVNSKGIDSYGNYFFGIINWNTCLLYPEGISCDQIEVHLTLKLPVGWKYASSLEVKKECENEIVFAPISFSMLIDSPLICGQYMHSVEICADGAPSHYWHYVSESPKAVKVNSSYEGHYLNMVKKAKDIFGEFHCREYHFLNVLSDITPVMGLEHLNSSLNGLVCAGYENSWELRGRTSSLLPHEYIHSWCGKYHQPKGMAIADFHSDKDLSLLWVYEGLTQYLGEILEVRSGFLSFEKYLERFMHKIHTLQRSVGRSWRSLEDTCLSSHLLRGGSPYWGALRRNQDYYNEGLLIWLEVDTLIRQNTSSTLDEFCHIFLGQKGPADKEFRPYDLEEVILILNGIYPYDWKNFFQKRAQQPMEGLSLEAVHNCGYKVAFTSEPNSYQKEMLKEKGIIHAIDSLGLEINLAGQITTIIPESPADRAGVSPTAKVAAVNNKKLSQKNLEEALSESVDKKSLDLLLCEKDFLYTKTVSYDGGVKYFQLERNLDKPDLLSKIMGN